MAQRRQIDAEFISLLLTLLMVGCTTTHSLPATPYPIDLGSERETLWARLGEHESNGFDAEYDSKWSPDERRAIGIAWERFKTGRPEQVYPRYRVTNVEDGVEVMIVWETMSAEGRLYTNAAGAGVFAITISPDWKSVRVHFVA